MKMLNRLMTLALLISQPGLAMTPSGVRSGGLPSTLPVDSRCSLSAGGQVIDYGNLSRWQLQDATGSANTLTPGKRTLMVSVVCPYTQAMRLTLRGESAANGNLRYGERGNMRIALRDAQLDGQSVQFATTTVDGTLNGAPAATLALQPGQTFTAMTAGGVAKGRSLTLRLEIEPVLPEAEARTSMRRISEAQLTLDLGN
ncbi:hypothetical protein C4K19_3752 [Pseudomonas chlororaphis subsp. aurantiaca]|uniref:fimbrial protein n=1 Tax=Pseudomonas chlororaphis TaxID=587753 RepID=UPI000F58C205|nr:fimbrial protein [Pseudomonas chlororaphis]AZD55537.1 hypothetical protein C4K19_3752 [Pseudomonas chlororaphis subsp. aurantiaca]